jgi:hypothetical protein
LPGMLRVREIAARSGQLKSLIGKAKTQRGK